MDASLKQLKIIIGRGKDEGRKRVSFFKSHRDKRGGESDGSIII